MAEAKKLRKQNTIKTRQTKGRSLAHFTENSKHTSEQFHRTPTIHNKPVSDRRFFVIRLCTRSHNGDRFFSTWLWRAAKNNVFYLFSDIMSSHPFRLQNGWPKIDRCRIWKSIKSCKKTKNIKKQILACRTFYKIGPACRGGPPPARPPFQFCKISCMLKCRFVGF